MGNTTNNWVKEFPSSITVTDTEGVIIEMNDASIKQFAKSGGAALIGTNSLDCHPEPSRSVFAGMLADPIPNVYTIEKGGKKTLIYQMPWYRDGEYGGYVEMSIELPLNVPNHVRG